MKVRFWPFLLATGIGAWAQAPAQQASPQAPVALMNTQSVNQMCQRTTQLMEAGGVAVPDLQRASAPIIERVKNDCIQLQARPGFGDATYSLISNLRAYISLADAIPKPFPFPETARQQFAELRDDSARLESHFRALLDSKDAQLRTSDRDNLERYSEANRKLAPPVAGKPRVVFMGDSITDFWRLNEYFPEHDFVNRGISGQITGEMLGRMKADVLDLRPSGVVILAGTNDLARGIPLIQIEDNYLMMADLAALYKVKVIFASVLPVSDYHKNDNPSYERTVARPPAYIKALNDWMEKVCSQRGFVYLDYYSAMIDGAGLMQSDMSDDGLHPNAKGYRIMAPLVLDAVHKAFAAPAPAAPKPAAPSKPARRRGTSNN